MNTSQRVIALAGLSGAGKTTLLRNVSNLASFLHLSASDLIKEQIKREEGTERNSENLRFGNIPDNQTRLVEAYKRKTRNSNGHIVVDCHTIIDTPDGLQYIPASTFEAIGITDFLFLKINSNEIFKRRSKDISRSRPERSVEELAAQQEIALQSARKISKILNVSFTVLQTSPDSEFLRILKSFSTNSE